MVEKVAAVVPRKVKARKPRATRYRTAEGMPTLANPTFALALPGAAPIGVPSFFIDKFRIPPFLLPIYQAAGIQYGVRWEVLAAINEIETDYGRNLNVSSAGALGWMQFMPATWKQYGTDANRDGKRDPYNPVDAIFAAARYLKAAGAGQDLRKAVFAYNHADWYVDCVLMRARVIGGLPGRPRRLADRLDPGPVPGPRAHPVRADDRRDSITLFADAGSPVVAVQDGKIVKRRAQRAPRPFLQLRDAYGNTYTYGLTASVASVPATSVSPAPRARSVCSRIRSGRRAAHHSSARGATSPGARPRGRSRGPER